jgi:hypothetical protein
MVKFVGLRGEKRDHVIVKFSLLFICKVKS